MTGNPRAIGMLAAALAAAILLGGSVSSQAPAGLLRYGMTEGTIENANPNDARAASLLWARGIADAMGGLYSGAEAEVFPTPSAAALAINTGRADVMAISSLEYLSIEKTMKATPSMVWELAGSVMVDYVLLARTNGGARLPTVTGKSLAIYAASRPWSLSDVWTDVMLADAGVPDGQKAFSSVKVITKKGHAAMAVYFGQSDFAIESRSAFETAAEMNPQLGKDLMVLARSPQFIPGLVCLNDAMGGDTQKQYVANASHLHEQARYRQAFMVMRVTRLAPWKPQYLESVRAMVARHRALQARR
jgi:ABC-type phosphate/phosphonate transport system substrate-binding protein